MTYEMTSPANNHCDQFVLHAYSYTYLAVIVSGNSADATATRVKYLTARPRNLGFVIPAPSHCELDHICDLSTRHLVILLTLMKMLATAVCIYLFSFK